MFEGELERERCVIFSLQLRVTLYDGVVLDVAKNECFEFPAAWFVLCHFKFKCFMSLAEEALMDMRVIICLCLELGNRTLDVI